jgi:hypothetical protein
MNKNTYSFRRLLQIFAVADVCTVSMSFDLMICKKSWGNWLIAPLEGLWHESFDLWFTFMKTTWPPYSKTNRSENGFECFEKFFFGAIRHKIGPPRAGFLFSLIEWMDAFLNVCIFEF